MHGFYLEMLLVVDLNQKVDMHLSFRVHYK